MKEADSACDSVRGAEDRRCTPNIRALSVSAPLFTCITIPQVFAAVAARSQASMTDCICSGVDAFTYAGNVLVECCKRRPGEHAVPQLIIVFLSLGLLCSFTQDALQESWRTVHVCRGKAEEEEQDADVNGWITLAFGAFGVAFDVTCMLEFRKSHKRQGRSVNMFSAILHVGADFLRSTSTLVMSFIILSSKVDSNCVDAYTSIVIGATIIAGALVGFWKWLRLLFRLCFGWGSKEATAASVA